MRLLRILLCLGALHHIGCASDGFHRGALWEQVGVDKPVYDDEEIAKTFQKKANLLNPFKLAVFFQDPVQNTSSNRNWRWKEEDKKQIIKTLEEMKQSKLISQVFPIVGLTVKNNDLNSIRMAAARHGADAVLVLNGDADIDRGFNNLAWSYLLVAPAFFVEGSEADVLFQASATMWDVRNEYLYLTTQAEGTYSYKYKAAFSKTDKDLISKAKNKSLVKLGPSIAKMVGGK